VSYLDATRNATAPEDRIVISQGVFPIFGNLIEALATRLQRPPVIGVPDGTYGPIYPLIEYFGGVIQKIETKAKNGFILDPRVLKKPKTKPDLLWLTQPNNPSGLFFEPDQVRSLMEMCSEQDIYVLSDEIFFLLSDHRLGAWTPSYISFGSFLERNE